MLHQHLQSQAQALLRLVQASPREPGPAGTKGQAGLTRWEHSFTRGAYKSLDNKAPKLESARRIHQGQKPQQNRDGGTRSHLPLSSGSPVPPARFQAGLG